MPFQFIILMLASGDTHSRNLHQKLARVSVNLVHVFFWYKFLAHNWAQLCSRTETVWHVTRTVQRDWPRVVLVQETTMNLRQIFHASFWYKFLERVSPASHARTYANDRGLSQWAMEVILWPYIQLLATQDASGASEWPNINRQIISAKRDLVCSADQVEVVFVEELGDDFSAERERHSAVVLSPAHRLLVRVGPQQVTQQTLVRHVRRTHDTPDLLHRLQVGTQSCQQQRRSSPDNIGDTLNLWHPLLPYRYSYKASCVGPG